MPKFNSLGDRMKFYEKEFGENLTYLMPMVPAVIRLDGRAFHTFTKGLDKPFDQGLVDLMTETTKQLVEETGAVIGYTQSDEISLVLLQEDHESQIYFDGRVGKINSLLAANCSNYFISKLLEHIPSKAGQHPMFDCRCFSVPNRSEAINAILWREQDATRNSIQMLAQSQFSHNALHGLSCNELQELLWSEKNINWNDLDSRLKRGTYIQKRRVERAFTADEIDRLPLKHAARTNPELKVVRREVLTLEMPILTKVINKEEVFFYGADPITEEVE